MKVLYDYQAFIPYLYSGVSNCFCKLISNLPCDITPIVSVLQSNNYHLIESGLIDDLNPALVEKCMMETKHFPGKWRLYKFLSNCGLLKSGEYVNRKYSIELQRNQDYDIFHPTFFDPYFLNNIGNKPFVLTIHDMMPELFPEYYSKNNMQIIAKRKLVDKAAAIIAVSETTKNDIVKILGVNPEKISVIYHAGPEREDIRQTPLVEGNYFLYVGVRAGYKNWDKMIVDFKKFANKNHEFKLVCTGPAFSKREIDLIKSLNLEDKIIHHKANNIELKNLYANAVAFLYPSLYEGFGIPILEAFAYGCPVILNEASCFPEIGNSAAIYFSSDGSGSKLEDILTEFVNFSNEDRNRIIQRGYDRLNFFSWTSSSEKLAEVYRKIFK